MADCLNTLTVLRIYGYVLDLEVAILKYLFSVVKKYFNEFSFIYFFFLFQRKTGQKARHT